MLTTLLLLRAGHGYAPFSSLERVIEELHLRQLTRAGRLRLQGAGRDAWHEIA